MKKLLFLTNIPAPYRIDFFNALGKVFDLTVIFEARRAKGIRFNWNEDTIRHFRAIFLSDREIQERRVDFKIFRYLKNEDYDCIIATSYGYLTEMAALLYLLAHRRPYYLELDGGVVRPGEPFFKRIIKERLIRGARGIFSSSLLTDGVMRHYGARDESLHRYPFTSLHEKDLLTMAPTQEEKRKLRQELGMGERICLLGVGQFIHRKGFDILLRAARTLPGDIGIYLAGAEPTADYLALTEGMENVHYLRFLGGEDVKRYMRASDIFVLPTREDMWGLVVNEALANALPVITTRGCVAGMELIADGENGVLIPVEDENALRDAILRLYADAGLRECMAREALRRIVPYTVENMVRVHEEILTRNEE